MTNMSSIVFSDLDAVKNTEIEKNQTIEQKPVLIPPSPTSPGSDTQFSKETPSKIPQMSNVKLSENFKNIESIVQKLESAKEKGLSQINELGETVTILLNEVNTSRHTAVIKRRPIQKDEKSQRSNTTPLNSKVETVKKQTANTYKKQDSHPTTSPSSRAKASIPNQKERANVKSSIGVKRIITVTKKETKKTSTGPPKSTNSFNNQSTKNVAVVSAAEYKIIRQAREKDTDFVSTQTAKHESTTNQEKTIKEYNTNDEQTKNQQVIMSKTTPEHTHKLQNQEKQPINEPETMGKTKKKSLLSLLGNLDEKIQPGKNFVRSSSERQKINQALSQFKSILDEESMKMKNEISHLVVYSNEQL